MSRQITVDAMGTHAAHKRKFSVLLNVHVLFFPLAFSWAALVSVSASSAAMS